MITHDLGIVAHMAHRILVMDAGKIVESGSSEDIFYRPQHPYTQALLRAVPRLDLKEDQELAFIQGVPPSMIEPPKGCAFCTRCEKSMLVCEKYVPPKFEFEEGHFANCWLYHPLASLEKEGKAE